MTVVLTPLATIKVPRDVFHSGPALGRRGDVTFKMIARDGRELDAHLDIQDSDIRLYSRSGARSSPSARNPDYPEALREILGQLADAGIKIRSAYVDSGKVQTLPLIDRQILFPAEAHETPEGQFSLLSQRMRLVARNSSKPGGNNNKLIRIVTDSSAGALRTALRLQAVPINLRSAGRIPDATFKAVKAHHVWQAVEELRTATDFAPFAPSIDYDLVLDDGVRLPPKAVFGRAASIALGINVLPAHFAGGVGTLAFRAIQDSGFTVAEKGSDPLPVNVPPSEEESWAEGSPKLKIHLQRERASGLSQAKKSAFREAHQGRLYCEACNLEPEIHYGDPVAATCIEAHHKQTAVSAMLPDHQTKLADLECLCANCHRLVHARLRADRAGAGS